MVLARVGLGWTGAVEYHWVEEFMGSRGVADGFERTMGCVTGNVGWYSIGDRIGVLVGIYGSGLGSSSSVG